MKKYLFLTSFLFITLCASSQSYSPERGNVRIGSVTISGNTNVPLNAITKELYLDFTGYRDIEPDQVGARISALRFNIHQENNALRQNTGLAFYTNPIGLNSGTTDLVERMRITPYGNVGIGTYTPSYKLDIAGNLRATTAYFESENNSGIRIGKLADGGNLDVLKGALAAQINLDFTGYRDSEPDQIGARISALRFNSWDGKALVQNTGLAFYTNPVGWNKGILDIKERMRISPLGNVGIGTANPEYLLDVAGVIRAQEVRVEINEGADHVFEKHYNLRPLHEIESFVQENKHLPEVPSEKEMQEEGLNINEFQIKLLQKIEELTLYIIDQDKRINNQENKLNEQNLFIKHLMQEALNK